MKNKKLFTLLLLVILCMSTSHKAFAADFQLLSPSINAIPLPVGSGARALGQGGAFIAVADDATAASWNPGGLTQLERPEFSIVGSFLSTRQDFDDNTQYTFDNQTVSRGNLNYASFVYPFKIFGKNIVTSLNYQQVYDFHMNLDYKAHYKGTQQTLSYDIIYNKDFESKGGIGVLTPAIAMQILPKLSFGMSVNVYTDEFFGNYAWKQVEKGKGSGTVTDNTTNTTIPYNISYVSKEKFMNFQAVNLTLGMLWNVWEKDDKCLTFGAVFKTPFEANVDRKFVFNSIESPRKHYEIDYPASLGMGLNFRFNDAFSMSTDATWTDWSEYTMKDEKGMKTRPFGDGTSKDEDVDDTDTIRCGTEYLLFQKSFIIPVRGGLFYEPRPSLGNPVDVYGVSVGSGITFQKFSLDAAYQFRWATNGAGEDLGISGTHFDIEEHLFLSSIIVYF